MMLTSKMFDLYMTVILNYVSIFASSDLHTNLIQRMNFNKQLHLHHVDLKLQHV